MLEPVQRHLVWLWKRGVIPGSGTRRGGVCLPGAPGTFGAGAGMRNSHRVTHSPLLIGKFYSLCADFSGSRPRSMISRRPRPPDEAMVRANWASAIPTIVLPA